MDILKKCHVASDGNTAFERLKRRQHRGMLLLFGTVVMFRVARKVPGGVVTGDGFVIKRRRWRIWTRSRALRGLPLVF